jgi:hypothetical protein
MNNPAKALLEFAVRLYTRINQEGEAGFGKAGFALPKKKWWIDNGKRSIQIELTYGPLWEDEE